MNSSAPLDSGEVAASLDAASAALEVATGLFRSMAVAPTLPAAAATSTSASRDRVRRLTSITSVPSSAVPVLVAVPNWYMVGRSMLATSTPARNSSWPNRTGPGNLIGSRINASRIDP